MARFRLDFGAITRFLHDPTGPVARLISQLTTDAAQVARAKVRVRTGETLSSIQEDVHFESDDPYGDIHGGPWGEVKAEFATFFLEKGVKEHLIFAHGDYSLAHEKIEYFGPVVIHPGFAPKPFLTTGLDSLQGEV